MQLVKHGNGSGNVEKEEQSSVEKITEFLEEIADPSSDWEWEDGESMSQDAENYLKHVLLLGNLLHSIGIDLIHMSAGYEGDELKEYGVKVLDLVQWYTDL